MIRIYTLSLTILLLSSFNTFAQAERGCGCNAEGTAMMSTTCNPGQCSCPPTCPCRQTH